MKHKHTQAEALALLYLNKAEIRTALALSKDDAAAIFAEAKRREAAAGLYSVSPARVNRRMVEQVIGWTFDDITQKAATK